MNKGINGSMKKQGTILLMLAMALLLIFARAETAQAETYPTVYNGKHYNRVYSYKYYTRTHPSVVKAVGTDPEKVLQYFVLCGMPRGHQAISSFNVKEYYESHKSLRKILGKGYRKYYLYYQLYGRFGDESAKAKKGIKIFSTTVCLDPGHQSRGMSAREPIGPGSGTYKDKCSSGTYGRWSRLNEYQVVIKIALKLRTELQARGYNVVMTRTRNDVRLSNIDRAQIANKNKADLMIRLHCDGQDYGSWLHGARGMAAAGGNRYLSAKTVSGGQNLARQLARCQSKATGQPMLETLYTNEMTGINWAKMPCAIIEMGYMSNPSEDLNLARSSYQETIAKGLANGVDAYIAG